MCKARIVIRFKSKAKQYIIIIIYFELIIAHNDEVKWLDCLHVELNK